MVITLPEDYNYIAAFLTFRCQLGCFYCINKINLLQRTGELDGKTWVKIFDKIEARDIPITLQGGEPTLHRDFYYIVNNVKDSIRFDLLTNLQFDIDDFIRNVHPDRIKRDAPYASIRASYHPVAMKYEDLKMRTLKLLDKGYQVGIWAVLHPEYEEHINLVKEDALKSGIDFRLKPFLGFHDNKLHGEYAYPGAVCKLNEKKEYDQQEVLCRTTELLIAPDGAVYNCHHDLYTRYNPIGNIANDDFELSGDFRKCRRYGYCNPCDIKIKFNRFQQWGHCSVSIKT